MRRYRPFYGFAKQGELLAKGTAISWLIELIQRIGDDLSEEDEATLWELLRYIRATRAAGKRNAA